LLAARQTSLNEGEGGQTCCEGPNVTGWS